MGEGEEVQNTKVLRKTAVKEHKLYSCQRCSARTASATEHHFWTIQMIAENVYVWLAAPRV